MSTHGNVRRNDANRLEDELTRSELSCLALVAEGKSAASIGDQLALSSREIELLLFCAQRKLGAGNVLQAISIALSKGIITV